MITLYNLDGMQYQAMCNLNVTCNSYANDIQMRYIDISINVETS